MSWCTAPPLPPARAAAAPPAPRLFTEEPALDVEAPPVVAEPDRPELVSEPLVPISVEPDVPLVPVPLTPFVPLVPEPLVPLVPDPVVALVPETLVLVPGVWLLLVPLVESLDPAPLVPDVPDEDEPKPEDPCRTELWAPATC